MRRVAILAALAAGSGTIASSWFPGTKSAYNKWHETELERWLSDHDIPYPSPAERYDLVTLVDKNWNEFVLEPYKKWDSAQLSSFLQAKGRQAGSEIGQSRDSLVAQVKADWYETDENARQAWASVKEWIFDTWTESQLKAFCDKNDIPVPQPRHRDTLLQKTRSGYESAAKNLGETAAYPGDWLYKVWSESDLKSWLDTHGFPVPQLATRDRLVATVRRNSRLAYLKAKREAASVTSSARATYATLTDMIIDLWSESQLKEFCDKNGIPVPQGTRINALRALVRKHRAELLGDTIGSSASSIFEAATTKASNEFAQASDDASLTAQSAFDEIVRAWSESRLKAYLDSRGVPIPQPSSIDQLRSLVRKNSHKARPGGNSWKFDDLSRENLKKFLTENGNAAAKNVAKNKDVAREELVSAARSAYASAHTAGSINIASVTSALAAAAATAESGAYDTWTETDLKAHLDSYGVAIPQGSKLEELKALARKHSTYFKYGASSPSQALLAKIESTVKKGWEWVTQQFKLGSQVAREKKTEVDAATEAKVREAKQEL